MNYSLEDLVDIYLKSIHNTIIICDYQGDARNTEGL